MKLAQTSDFSILCEEAKTVGSRLQGIPKRRRIGFVIVTTAALLFWTTVCGSAMAQPPASDSAGAANYARTLSKAFREAAQKVLPSVVAMGCSFASQPA